MPILEGDIKLLKSAVMADTSDGGGAMTDVAVIDGQSNNLFPDTSEMDRALGRVAMRKVFGVAHTSDTDTLLGAHAVITDAPDDPLVHCTLMATSGWGDTRTVAKEAIEKYLVKGPRYTIRIQDTHYAGSLTLRLYAEQTVTDFPTGGDAIVLRNVNGQEQYVRVLKTSKSFQTYTVPDGELKAVLVSCELGQALAYDFFGAPLLKTVTNEINTYASLYSTTPSAGTRFYGVKPLGEAAAIGDIAVTTDDGIFTPLVPAATIESALVDQYPLTGRTAFTSVAFATATVTPTSGTLGASTVLTAPTTIQPGSLAMTHGATGFTDSNGLLMQGATAVGAVDYALGKITMYNTAPAYGAGTTTLVYRPGSLTSASPYSAALTITSANQGLVYTNVFEPPPARGSLTVSYMAQGAWYELTDNGTGKLSGADPGYGIGTIDYATGSMSVTCGAIPDIGSAIMADWGDPSSAKAITSTPPTRLYAELPLQIGAVADSIVATWSRGGTNYTATSDANGNFSGDATGSFRYSGVALTPTVFPDGAITLDYDVAATVDVGFINPVPAAVGTGVTYSAAGPLPIKQGTVRGTVQATSPSVWEIFGAGPFEHVLSFNDSNGVLRAYDGGTILDVGTINYTTGELWIREDIVRGFYEAAVSTAPGGWQTGVVVWDLRETTSQYTATGLLSANYSAGTLTAAQTVTTPATWHTALDLRGLETLLPSSVVFTLGADLYSVAGTTVQKGWNPYTALPAVANAGSMLNTGALSVTSLPANGVNSFTLINAAQFLASKRVSKGVFRTVNAPLKAGVFQLQVGAGVGAANDAGTLTGAFTGTVDYVRGMVTWVSGIGGFDPALLSYNAVFLQYLPLEAALLGLETARLPLDGKVPIFRAGGLVIVHNTQTYALPNPLVKGTVYNVGRVRVAAMKVKTATGATVDTTLYTTDLDAGTITFPVESDLTGLDQPFSVDHRIEDMVVCSVADISGKLTFTRNLTHNYPANTSYASSVLAVGDVFARAHNFVEQATWTGVWSDALVGSAPLANFNETSYPLVVTNKGAITERWALIFTNTTAFNIVGESVGNVGTGNTAADCAPINPATGVPYFSIPATGWGNGWAVGNVYRFNTAACGAPIWVVRTVLQGPATLQDDKFTLAFRGDVDRP